MFSGYETVIQMIHRKYSGYRELHVLKWRRKIPTRMKTYRISLRK